MSKFPCIGFASIFNLSSKANLKCGGFAAGGVVAFKVVSIARLYWFKKPEWLESLDSEARQIKILRPDGRNWTFFFKLIS